jgi:hypothetical protein
MTKSGIRSMKITLTDEMYDELVNVNSHRRGDESLEETLTAMAKMGVHNMHNRYGYNKRKAAEDREARQELVENRDLIAQLSAQLAKLKGEQS